jgi:O-antigen biosynthesis protein
MNVLMMTSAAPKMAVFSTDEKRPPLGVGFLISVMKTAGHQVYFVDNYLNPSNVLETDFLIKRQIDFVGIYSNTICYQGTLLLLHKLQYLREKRKWNGKIIVGGPHTSVGSNSIPEFVDHVVVGEGEVSILEIISGTETDRIVYGKKVTDMDNLPLPAWEEFVYLPYMWRDPWIDTFPVYTFNTSRGCSFDCNFCSVQSVWGKAYRFMSAERVVSDIEYMIKYYGLKGAYFREDHFTLSKARVVDFCELLLRKNIRIEWICETRVDNLCDLEYLKLISKAGCRAFYIGVESGSPRMLEFFKKGETVEQFVDAFGLAKKVGIKTYASFVVGAPTETGEDRKATHDLISILKPDYYSTNIYAGIPGSELYEYVRKNRLYEYEDLNKVLYLKGHNKRVNKYYHGNPYFKIPSTVRKKQIVIFEMKKKIGLILKQIKNKIQY